MRPGAPPVFNMFLSLLYDNRILRVYWTLLLWMMFFGQARHFLLGPLTLVSGFLTLVVGFRMWRSLHRLVLAWSREIAAQLRSASVGLAMPAGMLLLDAMLGWEMSFCMVPH